MLPRDLYAPLLVLHIFAVALLVGHSFTVSATLAQVRRAPARESARSWLNFAVFSSRANPPISLAVLLTGVLLGSAGWWRQSWFAVAIALWLLNTVLAVTSVRPSAARLGAALAASTSPVIDPTSDALRHAPSLTWALQVMRALDVSLLWVMVRKPTWTGSVGAAAVAVAVGVTLAVVEHARTQRAAPAGAAAPTPRVAR